MASEKSKTHRVIRYKIDLQGSYRVRYVLYGKSCKTDTLLLYHRNCRNLLVLKDKKHNLQPRSRLLGFLFWKVICRRHSKGFVSNLFHPLSEIKGKIVIKRAAAQRISRPQAWHQLLRNVRKLQDLQIIYSKISCSTHIHFSASLIDWCTLHNSITKHTLYLNSSLHYGEVVVGIWT